MEKEQTKKKLSRWKIALIACLSFLVVAGAVFGVLFGVFDLGYSINKMFISNFDNYTALGAGYIREDLQSSVPAENSLALSIGKTYAASSGQRQGNYLVGKKDDGSIEKISFSRKQNGSGSTKQKGYVRSIVSLKNFTFVEISSKFVWPEENMSVSFLTNSRMYPSIKSYIIDNNTGKIFYLNDVVDFEVINQDKDANFMYNMECDDCCYIFAVKEDINATYHKYYYVYRVSIENGDLKLEEVVNSVDFPLTGGVEFADKYGNLYFNNHNVGYYVLSNGSMKLLTYDLTRSLNGIVYSGSKKVNENGELVESSWTGKDRFLNFSRDNLVKKEGNEEYYLETSSYSTAFEMYHITWQNDEEFTAESVVIDGWSAKYAATQNKIYFYKDTKIYSFDIKTTTGEVTRCNYDYIFKNIYPDNLGNVIFEGVSMSNMNNIIGVIYNDGTIDISESARKYSIYYIKALN